MNSPGTDVLGWQDSTMKISGNFNHVYPLKKEKKCQVPVAWPPPSPSGFLLSILAPKWAASQQVQ